MDRIMLTPQAQQDIDGHIDDLFARNPQGAQRVYDDIIDRIRKLQDFPLVSRIGALKGTRKVFTRYNNRVVFEIIGEEISILHVRHGRQQWPPEEDEEDDPAWGCKNLCKKSARGLTFGSIIAVTRGKLAPENLSQNDPSGTRYA